MVHIEALLLKQRISIEVALLLLGVCNLSGFSLIPLSDRHFKTSHVLPSAPHTWCILHEIAVLMLMLHAYHSVHCENECTHLNHSPYSGLTVIFHAPSHPTAWKQVTLACCSEKGLMTISISYCSPDQLMQCAWIHAFNMLYTPCMRPLLYANATCLDF